jgi:cell wall-associated NlpC family hydrolase
MPDAFALANAFVRIRPTSDGFRPEADKQLNIAMAGMDRKVKIGAQTDAAKLAATDLRAYLDTLTKRIYELRLKVSDPGVAAQLTRTVLLLNRLDKRITPEITLLGATRAQAQLLGVEAAAQRAEKGMQDANVTTARFTGLWGLLTNKTKIPLFGGQSFGWIPKLVVGIGALHLIVDVLAEVLAIIIPATLALGAFALAGSDSFKNVFRQVQNMHTAMDATGKTIPPFTRNLEKMHEAVRPDVYQLFGEGLAIVNAKTGEFNKLATGTARVLDNLAARIAVAVKSGGFSVFMRNAVDDVQQLGNVFGNLFGIIGNLLHAMPGIAQILLTATQNATGFIEKLTSTAVVQKIANFGLIGHGALVYVGLGATIAGKAIAAGIGGLAGLALKGGQSLTKMGGAGVKAGDAMFKFAGKLKGLAGFPWGWAAAAAIVVGFLAVKLITAKDATQSWLDSLQKTLMAENAVTGFMQLQADQVIVSRHLAAAQIEVHHAMTNVANDTRVVAGRAGMMNITMENAVKKSSDLAAGQRQLSNESNLYNSRLDRLAIGLGGVGEAQGFLIASGVTMGDMLKTGTHQWLMILQQVEATRAGYMAMGQQGNVLQQDINVLNLSMSDQFKSMQNLNSAWDTIIGTMTGGESAFITFEQDILSVKEAFHQVGGSSRLVTKTFDAVTGKAKTVHVSMDGLSAASLQLRQTWQTAFSGAQSLIDSLRLMSSLSPGGFPQVKEAMKLMIAQLIPLGKHAHWSRDELRLLGQEAGIKGVKSFKDLTKGLGDTHDAGKRLDKLVAGMGGNIQDLAKDASALAGTLKQDLINRFVEAKIAASHAGKDINTLAGDIVNNSSAGKRYHDATVLYKDFRQAGMDAKTAQRLIETMTGQIFKIPKSHHTTITAEAFAKGLLKYKMAIPGEKRADTGALEFHARGGQIRGWGSRDTVPAMLTPGEVVVPKPMVNAGAVDHLRGHLPGFASGGFVRAGNNVGRVVPFMDKADMKFEKAATSAFVKAAWNALKAAVKAAATGSGGSIAAYAKSFLGRIPYVWGARTLGPAGADCSGFVQAIYKHFGINAPGTSESQGQWVKRGPPQPGGLAFYISSVGGPPPGHVAMVSNTPGKVISQGGGMGPQWMGLHAMPLMFTGVPPGGFGGVGAGRSLRETQLSSLWRQAGGASSLAHLMGAIAMAESGGRTNAHNASGASGLWQIMPGSQRIGGNLFNPMINAENAVAIYRAQGLRAWSAYTNGAYLSFMNKGGMVKSFDKGGWLMPGATMAINRTGRPEPVGGHTTIIVKVDPVIAASTPDRKLGQAIAEHVKMHTKGGGRLYPPGVTPK